MQLLIFGFKDCLLGDKIFKKNQRPAKKKNPKNYKQETPPHRYTRRKKVLKMCPVLFKSPAGKYKKTISSSYVCDL